MGRPTDFAELQAWAIDEAAALVDRSVNARSDVVLREFDAVRKAFEAAARSIEAALTAPIEAREEVGGFVERLTAHAGLYAISTQLQESEAANRRLNQQLKDTQAEQQRLNEQLKDTQADHQRLNAQLKDTQAGHQRLNTQLKEVQVELDAAHTDLKAERARAEVARAETVHVTAEFESTLDELRREHATVIGEQAATYTSLPLDELLTVFNALAKATTVSEVLTSLVNGIAREFSRVALFDVHGSGLQGTRLVGFDFQSDISKVVIPLSGDSLLTRAVKTGRLEGFFAGPHSDPGEMIPFGGTPACALAIPIVVQRATVAVIYADDSDQAEFSAGVPQARAKFAELLQQHALLVLLRIWVDQSTRAQKQWRAEAGPAAPAAPAAPAKPAKKAEQRTRAELREFAIRLADQLETTYTADTEVGRNYLHC